MKLKLFAVLALGGLLSAAFACGDSSGDGGSGGSGGSGGGTTSSTKSATSSTKATTGTSPTTTTGTGTTTTSSGGCDDGTPSTIDSQLCSDCIDCSLGGNCSDELAAFQGDPDAQAFITCIDPCADDACFDACINQYPSAAQAYLDVLSCAICVECPNNCDAATNCM